MSRGLRILMACLAVTGCGGSDRSPSGPDGVMDFTGAWQGSYRISECTGERHCVLQIGQVQPFSLRLRQQGRTVDGVFATTSDTIDVAGEVEDRDTLVLHAVPPSTSADPVADALTAFDATLHGAVIAGQIAFTVGYRLAPSFPPVAYTRGGDVVSASRGTLSPQASFNGTWRGEHVVQACTPTGWLECHTLVPGTAYPIEVTLSQQGVGVSGSVLLGSYTVPVSGTVSGGTVSLTGSLDAAVSGGHVITRIVSWSATRDAVGRMRGALAFVEETRLGALPPQTMAANSTLNDVLQIP